ncbi:heavy-metal-associated domain-containing protein [Niabella beijingensis]|uniref:heavy-metal-associated domain-containing protein n=1 Tax=Niabella beijingensis TaxID=2872700 RepID=UPI001CBA9E7E|nr:heavy-metal-associated domain-containing protein [Niabella beijingensis]MBZ4192630.1 heavy-metal-associated domain-containing protein [Niabella beijingensis]
MKHLTVKVPAMQRTHCQTKVFNAIRTIPGVGVENITAGLVVVSVESWELKDHIVAAIETAGYYVELATAIAETPQKDNCCLTGVLHILNL